MRVDLADRSYDIVVGAGLIAAAGTTIAALRRGARCAIVTDATVASLHLPPLQASLDAAGLKHTAIVVASGERSKNFATFEHVVEALVEARVERGDLVIALGGGVVGDLAGFAASVVRRGVDVVQIPTTLLAQVDSSVGGKTAINSKHGKNLIGTFHQPVLVLADATALDTLPGRQFRAGYAEVAKYGLINDAAFFARLEREWQEVYGGGPARLYAIETSCRAKAAIVARDERESGDRALLNLGHTFGHALEQATGFSDRLLHGEAVAIGMAQAFRFSARAGLCPPDVAARVERHLVAAGLPTRLRKIQGDIGPVDGLMAAIAQDKKVARGSLTFILARDIGDCFVAKDVAPEKVRDFLAAEFEAT